MIRVLALVALLFWLPFAGLTLYVVAGDLRRNWPRIWRLLRRGRK